MALIAIRAQDGSEVEAFSLDASDWDAASAATASLIRGTAGRSVDYAFDA